MYNECAECRDNRLLVESHNQNAETSWTQWKVVTEARNINKHGYSEMKAVTQGGADWVHIWPNSWVWRSVTAFQDTLFQYPPPICKLPWTSKMHGCQWGGNTHRLCWELCCQASKFNPERSFWSITKEKLLRTLVCIMLGPPVHRQPFVHCQTVWNIFRRRYGHSWTLS